MKGLSFRRSLNKDRTSTGRPAGATPAAMTAFKTNTQIQPPKMVIKAIADYRSAAPQELSFARGDFFHVLSEPEATAGWFEACNPITNARGLVPVNCFEVLGKTARPGAGAGAGAGAGSSSSPGAGPSNSAGPSQLSPRQQTPAERAAGAAMTAKGGGGLYAIVKYDFDAERDDELGAKAGESIIVIAQSNFEWFVAKPIGRLGGPGLIPVAFVEIKDLVTGRAVENVEELISTGVIPKVEEWKKMTADYKKNTIPLGRFDFGNNNDAGAAQGALQPLSNGTDTLQRSPTLPPKDPAWQGDSQQGPIQGSYLQQGGGPTAEELPPGMPPGEPLPVGVVTQATVDSFHYEQGDYWFRIQANHVAGESGTAPPNAPRAAEGEERDLILYRLYEDFYEFQIALLDHFPAEAGRQMDEATGKQTQRILPLMPGPLERVDDYITAQRRGDLDQYISELCALPEYILRSELVRLFFEPRPGDHCTTHPPRDAAVPPSTSFASQKSLSKSMPGSESNGYLQQQQQQQPQQLSSYAAGQFSNAPEEVEEMRTPNFAAVSAGNGTQKYSEDSAVGSQHGRNPSSSSRMGGGSHDLSNRFDQMSVNARSSSNSHARSSGAAGGGGGMPHSSQGSSSNLSGSLQLPQQHLSRNASANTLESHDSRGSNGPHNGSAANASMSSSSSSNMVKIKIFHRANDDLVAIRVPPSVSYSSLLGKVQDRLGPEICVLRYKDSSPDLKGTGTSGMVRMLDDEDLRDWLGSGAKLNLFADRT